jgi:hypothetical protein
VSFDGFVAEDEPGGDFFVGQPVRDESQTFCLPCGEELEAFGVVGVVVLA